jgi:tetratricopeptide (TPR) repeat protein
MLTFNLINVSLTAVKYEPSVTAIGRLGPTPAAAAAAPEELIVPWRDLQEHPPLFALLSWHTRLSEFGGRAAAMEALAAWATSPPAISVKFVTGEGGVGKSRLGAELASRLQREGWAAGFVDLRSAQAFPCRKAGTLLVVDYPEEHRDGVAELLRDLAGLGRVGRIRVLFLTRRPVAAWEQVVTDCHAGTVVDLQPVDLGGLDPSSAHRLYNSALEAAAQHFTTAPPPLSEEVITAWLQEAPANDRALFLVALAVHSARHPDEAVVKYTSKEVMEALVQRELERLRPIAEDLEIEDYALARLLAMAAIADRLPLPRIQELAQDATLHLGFPAGTDVRKVLQQAGLLIEDLAYAPKPDIGAAAFVVTVLGERPETAPELVWAALQGDLEGSLERFARLSHDAEVVLGIHTHRLRAWLGAAVTGSMERCTQIRKIVFHAKPPLGWGDAAVEVGRTLLAHADRKEDKAEILINWSNHLDTVGDAPGALAASAEAVAIFRCLAAAAPTRYEPDLAVSLNNWANRLAEVGAPGALTASAEAVAIQRRLAAAVPARHEPVLAICLTVWANRLAEVGDAPGALAAIAEAVAILRRLAAAAPARYEPDLAMSLNNWANYLAAVGDAPGALAASTEAVAIRRRLAAVAPARYEPDLAKSLGTLGLALRSTGDLRKAKAAFQEAIERIRSYVEQSPPSSPHHKLLAAHEAELQKTDNMIGG